MQNAVINMLLGMGVVFAVLAIIYGLIASFRLFAVKEPDKQEEKRQVIVHQEGLPEVDIPQGAMLDQTLVAVIAAAIAASADVPADSFIVRKIIRRK